MASTDFQYTILSEDTLSKIAYEINACIGVTAQEIEQANPDVSFTPLEVGQIINIPAVNAAKKGIHYTVRPGDDLFKITTSINALAGLTYQKIEQDNPSVNPNSIQVGQIINIQINNNTATPVQAHPIPDSPTVTPPVLPANIGYWHWTWHSSTAPSATTMGMAFSGNTDPAIAIQKSMKVKSLLKGDKYICLGGGGDVGKYTSGFIKKIIAAIQSGDFAGYQGIAFDVEGGNSGLSADFKELFTVTKTAGFKVLVTVSHSRPYGIQDGTELMRSFLADENIDFISPQLYTSGKETSNQYDAFGVKWSEYATSKGAVIPSIVKESYYNDALNYFNKQGVTLKGFIQWHQV